jgi:hypothetical protein
MKYTKKWMVVPFVPENKIENSVSSELSEILHDKKLGPNQKIHAYNQILAKNSKPFHSIIPTIPEKINDNENSLEENENEEDVSNIEEEISPSKSHIKTEHDLIPQQSLTSNIKQESLSEFTATNQYREKKGDNIVKPIIYQINHSDEDDNEDEFEKNIKRINANPINTNIANTSKNSKTENNSIKPSISKQSSSTNLQIQNKSTIPPKKSNELAALEKQNIFHSKTQSQTINRKPLFLRYNNNGENK